MDPTLRLAVAVAVVFVIMSMSSVALPVAQLLILKDRAAGPLERLRIWIAANMKLLNAGLLLVIAIMQISKGVQGLS